MSHEFKQTKRKPLSYVAAVKAHGDYWRGVIPVLEVTELRTRDWYEANWMLEMEKGNRARVMSNFSQDAWYAIGRHRVRCEDCSCVVDLKETPEFQRGDGRVVCEACWKERIIEEEL